MAHLGTRKLTISVTSPSVTGLSDVTPDVSTVKISDADSDKSFVSYAMAAAGQSKDWFLEMTIAQDAAAGSLWSLIWDHAGESCTALVRPYGNSTPSSSQPHFSGTCQITYPDGDVLGGDADYAQSGVQVVSTKWQFDSKPTKITS